MAGMRENPSRRRSARFWDRIAARYARRPVPDEGVYQEKLRITREHLTPESAVLEFGCGTGSTALAHAPFAGRILALDISQRMLAIAREKQAAAGIENVEFRQAALEDLHPAEGPWDAVLGLSILHLVADIDATIARVFGLVKPGGIFVSSTTCLGDFVPVFRYLGPIGHRLGVLPLLNIFTVTDLMASLERAGFTIEHKWLPGEKKSNAVFIVARKPG